MRSTRNLMRNLSNTEESRFHRLFFARYREKGRICQETCGEGIQGCV
jgi:hypothetical protein